MALDHSKLSFRQPGGDPVAGESWYEPANYAGGLTFMWFFTYTRQISHLVAPGFAMAMGIGFTFLLRSRLREGWTKIRVFWFIS